MLGLQELLGEMLGLLGEVLVLALGQELVLGLQEPLGEMLGRLR